MFHASWKVVCKFRETRGERNERHLVVTSSNHYSIESLCPPSVFSILERFSESESLLPTFLVFVN